MEIQESIEEIRARYGEPDVTGTYENPWAIKTQWFYYQEDGRVRYFFFVAGKALWDILITEEKMLQVLYEENSLKE